MQKHAKGQKKWQCTILPNSISNIQVIQVPEVFGRFKPTEEATLLLSSVPAPQFSTET